MRLREAGVPESTIADILWHTRMGHYSGAQALKTFDALERITNERGNRTLAMIPVAGPLTTQRNSKNYFAEWPLSLTSTLSSSAKFL